MKNYVLIFGKKALGAVLIIGGILGLFLPFFQGVAMIIVGAILLENKFVTKKVGQLIAYIKRWRRK